ncbi:MAG TPA: ribosomal protein S18-alanine N-acetyltransferase [Burkholderiales bacterium]
MSAVIKPAAPRLVPMRAADLDRVLPIERDIYDFPWTRGNFEDSMTAGYSCWLYMEEAVLIGYSIVMLAVDEAHLLNLSVARAAQGQGHGRALLETSMAAIHEHGAAAMLLEVRPSNAIGRQLYASAGFTQVGLRKDYYPALRGREDALVLKRALSATS